MLWSVNGTAKCIPVILFLPVYFFLISSWLGQDFYIITRPKSYFPYLPLWAYFPGRNIPANSTGKYQGWNLPLNLADIGCRTRVAAVTSEVFTPALSTPLKKGSHLIKILQAIVFIWLHTCLPFRTNQFTWGVFNNVSDDGTLDVLVPGFTRCKYVALSTNAHLVEHALGLVCNSIDQHKAHWRLCGNLPYPFSLQFTSPTLPYH